MVVDNCGNVIKQKNNYSVTIMNAETGNAIGSKDVIPANIRVEVNANGNIVADAVSVELTPGKALPKFKVNNKSFWKTYTGEAIELEEEDFAKIDCGGTKIGEDFEVVGYQNNLKKGTMKVTVQGCGNGYSGTQTFSVKIKARKIDQINN